MPENLKKAVNDCGVIELKFKLGLICHHKCQLNITYLVAQEEHMVIFLNHLRKNDALLNKIVALGGSTKMHLVI